ncbi:MAG: hypothetical protein HQL40_04835 [Alphaproteobacteria bacterium]|nr:hypothetical protein [Alphaproteobacteria bacterium]
MTFDSNTPDIDPITAHTVSSAADLFVLCRSLGANENCGFCPLSAVCAGEAPRSSASVAPLSHH